jgi:hypothetical protein
VSLIHTLKTCNKLNNIAEKISYIDISSMKIFDGKKSPLDKGIKRWKS